MNLKYKSDYLKIKKKYIELKKYVFKFQMGGGEYEYESYPFPQDRYNPISAINKIKYEAHKNGFKLLKKLAEKKLHIATAESLTAGLIFSTLVDIPYAGYYKYGSFGVYDTDAKRTFLGVKVDDVYTHKCAKEMAIGILKNSNATIGISVTGNAMPLSKDKNKVGEVFIGIAGYSKENEIFVSTKSYNFCKDFSTCNLWYDVINQESSLKNILSDEQIKNVNNRQIDTFNDIEITSLIAQFIRYSTVNQAFIDCFNFINGNTLDSSNYKNVNIDHIKNDLSNNILLSYKNDVEIICDNDTKCNDDKRVFMNEFKLK